MLDIKDVIPHIIYMSNEGLIEVAKAYPREVKILKAVAGAGNLKDPKTRTELQGGAIETRVAMAQRRDLTVEEVERILQDKSVQVRMAFVENYPGVLEETQYDSFIQAGQEIKILLTLVGRTRENFVTPKSRYGRLLISLCEAATGGKDGDIRGLLSFVRSLDMDSLKELCAFLESDRNWRGPDGRPTNAASAISDYNNLSIDTRLPQEELETMTELRLRAILTVVAVEEDSEKTWLLERLEENLETEKEGSHLLVAARRNKDKINLLLESFEDKELQEQAKKKIQKTINYLEERGPALQGTTAEKTQQLDEGEWLNFIKAGELVKMIQAGETPTVKSYQSLVSACENLDPEVSFETLERHLRVMDFDDLKYWGRGLLGQMEAQGASVERLAPWAKKLLGADPYLYGTSGVLALCVDLSKTENKKGKRWQNSGSRWPKETVIYWLKMIEDLTQLGYRKAEVEAAFDSVLAVGGCSAYDVRERILEILGPEKIRKLAAGPAGKIGAAAGAEMTAG